MNKLNIKLSVAIIFSVLLIEGFLLIFSLSNKEDRLRAEQSQIVQMIGKEIPKNQLYSDEWIKKELKQYSSNIIWLSFLISLFMALSTVFIVYHFILKHMNKVNELNKNDDLSLFESHIPNDHIGDIIKTRNDMIQKVIKQQSLLKEESSAIGNLLLQNSKLASIGELSNGILHDIKNPLQSMSMTLELVKLQHPDTAESVAKCKQSLEVITDMVTKINLFSKNERSYSTFTSSKLIDDTLLLLDYKVKKSQVEIVRDIKTKEIHGDIRALSQILMNLISNGIDAVKSVPNPAIKIEVSQNQDLIEISVKDNGPGVSKEFEGNIFEPFFTTKKGSDGTGMGLSTSKKLTESFNGNLSYEFDSGAKFKITFPKLNH